MAGVSSGFAICGDIVHATEQSALELLVDQCIGVIDGKIEFLVNRSQMSDKLQEYGISEDSVRFLGKRQFLMPGLIDTHIHASQYANAGLGLDMGLLQWLERYTFPLECRYKDLKFAHERYTRVVNRTLRCGTTTACYFATIDTDASLVLCDIIDGAGQRGLVGKVNMNINSPDYYIEPSVEASVEETRRYINEVFARKYSHVTPVITPRFAISCTESLMKRLGDLAKEYNIPIQTHVCETKNEIEFVGKLYPEYENYIDVYNKTGLLTDKTVLAHGVYLTQPEIDAIKEQRSAISHCPNSNLSIRSGLLDVQKLIQQDVKVGLGTDVSGGYHPSVLDAMRTAVHVSNTHAIQNLNGYKPIAIRDAFKLATLGGAKALAIDDITGNFEVGKEFDALIIDSACDDSAIDVHDEDTISDLVDKFFFLGDDRNIVAIYVAGRQVHTRE